MTLTMKPGQGTHRATTKQAVVEIVVPVYNEAADLEELSPTDFLHVLRRAREDWEARTAQSIAITLQRFGARNEER